MTELTSLAEYLRKAMAQKDCFTNDDDKHFVIYIYFRGTW
jgi:hypothetical protein